MHKLMRIVLLLTSLLTASGCATTGTAALPPARSPLPPSVTPALMTSPSFGASLRQELFGSETSATPESQPSNPPSE